MGIIRRKKEIMKNKEREKERDKEREKERIR